LIFKLTNISESGKGGRVLFDVLASLAYWKGERIGSFSWYSLDTINNLLYINLNNESNQLLKFTSGKIDVVTNGDNESNVFLQSSTKCSPIEYTALSETESSSYEV